MSGSENKESVLSQIREKGSAYFYTKGESMLPMLKEGRDISVLTLISGEPKKGDVVLFVRPEKDDELVLHRVIRQRGGIFIIRGDNTYHNEAVKRENILAVLKGFFRKGKYFECESSKVYRVYSFWRMYFYPVRRFIRHTMRVVCAKIKNNVFHLNNLHLNDILGKNKSK